MESIDSETALFCGIIDRLKIVDVETCQYTMRHITPNELFVLLFSASATSGAYYRGEYGAIGRLDAWESLHAMVDDGIFVSNLKTDFLAQEYEWYTFSLDQWYDYVAWDLGIMGFNRNTNNVICLMATDTD